MEDIAIAVILLCPIIVMLIITGLKPKFCTDYFLYLTFINTVRVGQTFLGYYLSKQAFNELKDNLSLETILESGYAVALLLVLFIGNMFCDVLAHFVEVYKKRYVDLKSKSRGGK